MAELRRERRNSNSQLLQELDALSQTLYGQPKTSRRTASLALPRSATTPLSTINATSAADVIERPLPVADAATVAPRSRRMSMSPFLSRPKSDKNKNDADSNQDQQQAVREMTKNIEEKKGIWGWKPIRALAHVRMQRLSCLFSVEVVAIQGLPASMNGLRLSVAVRKKESKDGAVQTMPARVLQGSADFEETLFIRCHVYCSGKPLKFEPRLFLISAVAVDAPELDFGRNSVDLSLMVKKSIDRNSEGTRIRQWDAAFSLAGKAKGGEMVVKLGFQIMEDGGVEIYKQAAATSTSSSSSSSMVARRQSKSSFSVSSPKTTRSELPMMPEMTSMDLRGIDDFNLDEPGPSPLPPPPASSLKIEQEQKQDDFNLDFEVIDRGVEVQDQQEKQEEKENETAQEEEEEEAASVSSEVVKEVVHDSAHLTRLTELDDIAKQIKALESMMAGNETADSSAKNEGEDENQRLDAEEETVTREFLQMLELEDDSKELTFEYVTDLGSSAKPGGAGEDIDAETKCFLPDLGKGLGPVVQTRDGGILAAMNPFDTAVKRKETPKLAMQISKPVILKDQTMGSGIEVFQKLAAMGSEELGSKLASLMAMDELSGKTAEQIAFEGIASAIISGRRKEGGASSSAAKSVAALKTMSASMSDGRKERIVTGIWNVKEEPVVVDEILPFSLQKIEAMAVEALRIQAEVVEEEAPFDVSPLTGNANANASMLASTVSVDDWGKYCGEASYVTMLALVQLRDPLRRYEAVGAPEIVVVQAARVEGGQDEEAKFKVTSMHVGGTRSGEKHRLTAMQWLVAYGLGKAGKRRSKNVKVKGGNDLVWSISSRVMADMWLKPMRNPNVKFPERL